MRRCLQAEQLDALPPDAPEARRSRRDLQRINAWMGNVRLMAACLAQPSLRHAPRRIVDLGAGDGTFLLRLMQGLPGLAPGTELVLVDRWSVVDERVLAQMRARGFRPRAEQADAWQWLQAMPPCPGTWAVTNLFVHHFSPPELLTAFAILADKVELCCACEPRRSISSRLASRVLWLIGANAVTRHDAVASVRAGFCGRELSALWPVHGCWQVSEGRAGPFSHLFLARQTAAQRSGSP